MIRRHLSSVSLILAFFAFACGCASIQGNEQSSRADNFAGKITLAVTPFQSVTEARDSGRIISDILANQLYALGAYNVISPETVLKRLAEREGEPLSPSETGSLLGAPYILTGAVTEYTYKAGVGETPVVGVTARLIDVASGNVLWSATRTGTGGGNWFQEDSLSRLSVMICENLVASLNAFLQKDGLTHGAAQAAFNASGV